jgi:hypothetical protein
MYPQSAAARACILISAGRPAAIFLATSVDDCYTALVPDVIGEGAARPFSGLTLSGILYRIFKEKIVPWH